MAGRGAWPSSGTGGTLKYDGTGPGMFYRTPATGTKYLVNWTPIDVNQRAVKGAVKAYQRALNRRLGIALTLDGVLGPVTRTAIVNFQKARGATADGVIGQTTSKLLLCPDLQRIVNDERAKYPGLRQITPQIVCGVITTESAFDAGAVGFSDDRDIGLAQINGTAWPEYSEEERLDPDVAFLFVFNYFRMAVNDPIINDMDAAIASYNLGIGGARRWISQGRPQWYTPTGQTTARNVWAYIDKIKTTCELAPR